MPGHKKKELRKHLRQELKNIMGEVKKAKEELIVTNLRQLLVQLDPEGKAIIGGFAPLKDEVDWLTGMTPGPVQQMAFPAADSPDHSDFSMKFYQCRFEQLEENRDFGVTILTPPKKAQLVTPDILLIPGLGFATNGQRLGRGKGYYDRYLATYTGHRVGICFNEQLTDEIPTDDYDQNIHILVTDKNIYHCQQN